MTLFSQKYLHFILSIIYIMVFTATVSPKAVQQDGYLKLKTELNQIQILIDGNELNLDSIKVISLPPGKHNVTVLNPDRHLWGHLDWQQEITINSLDTTIVQPEFTNIVMIRTEPFGADVYLNNQLIGQTPLTKNRQEIIGKHILIAKQGFKDIELEFSPQESDFLNIHLKKQDEIFNFQQQMDRQEQILKNRYRRLAYGFWGVSILTGLTSVYLKNQADENYNKYLTAGSLKKMNRFYENTKEYDKLTNVSLGVLQGCFMLSFYFLMKSFE